MEDRSTGARPHSQAQTRREMGLTGMQGVAGAEPWTVEETHKGWIHTRSTPNMRAIASTSDGRGEMDTGLLLQLQFCDPLDAAMRTAACNAVNWSMRVAHRV